MPLITWEDSYSVKITEIDTQHKKEHTNFINKVAAFKGDFDNGKMMLSMGVIDFLKDWLLNHIKKTDMAYSDFFIEHGLR